jgi:hypothetical protein
MGIRIPGGFIPTWYFLSIAIGDKLGKIDENSLISEQVKTAPPYEMYTLPSATPVLAPYQHVCPHGIGPEHL